MPRRVNLVAANASLPPDAAQRYLQAHPEDEPLRGVLETIFEGLENVNEVGSLLQIDEQLDRAIEELRKNEACRANKQTEQLSLLPLLGLPEPAVQGRLDLDMLPPWEAWKQAVLGRLHQQFQREADAKDLSTAIFGAEAEKGLDLIALLSRRYDMVATNPPYMGSKNMGPWLRTYVQRHYSEGKRDLYAAFIQRSRQLARHGGKVAMVTQQSWIFLQSFAELRKGVLEHQMIECLAHLGEHGFEDPAAAGAFVALFVLSRELPAPEHRLWAARLVGLKNPAEKAALLCQAAQGRAPRVISSPLQARFLSIPQMPLPYWLRERFFDLLAGRTLGDVAEIAQGLGTANDARFVRFTWEAPPSEWTLPTTDRRWVPFEKGGGYGKWFGHHFWVVDWDNNGIRMKLVTIERYGNAGKRIYNEDRFFMSGYTYSYMARGSLGVRFMTAAIFGHKSPAIFKMANHAIISPLANCRFTSLIGRAISASIQLPEGCVSRIPFAEASSVGLQAIESSCVILKRWLVSGNLTERSFCSRSTTQQGLAATCRQILLDASAVAAVLHMLEGFSEKIVFDAYGLDADDTATIVDETGTPAGWFPLIQGYDQGLNVKVWDLGKEDEYIITGLQRKALKGVERLVLSAQELQDLKCRLRILYEAGPGGITESDEVEANTSEEDEVEELSIGAEIPIPTETFLEELSRKLEVHPISVYRLLEEGLEKEGWRCFPEERRLTTDRLSVIILPLLGHRWPTQSKAGEPVPEWVDPDGIIPLTDGSSEHTLLNRVRKRIAADFGEAHVDAIEQEFRQIMGRSLVDWLARDFFLHHISQFKRRPVAWLLESGRAVDTRWEAASSRRGRRSTRTGELRLGVWSTTTSSLLTPSPASKRTTCDRCSSGVSSSWPRSAGTPRKATLPLVPKLSVWLGSWTSLKLSRRRWTRSTHRGSCQGGWKNCWPVRGPTTGRVGCPGVPSQARRPFCARSKLTIQTSTMACG
jgi:hypothetical protein